MNLPPYSSMLGAGDGAPFEGEPLQQGLVTINCYVSANEYNMRSRSSDTDKNTLESLVYKAPNVMNRSVFRVFEHELCLVYVDNLSHQPSLNGQFGSGIKPTGQVNSQTREIYGRAGLSSAKFSSMPQIFSSLNRATTKPIRDGNMVFPKKTTYDDFFKEVNKDELTGYFPKDYHLFTSHFAFKCVGTAKTTDHNVAPLDRWDIAVNCGGRVHPFASSLVFAGQVIEWHLIDSEIVGNPEEYGKLVSETGNSHEKILVGLRENKSYMLDYLMDVVDGLNLVAIEKYKLKNTLNVFMKARIIGKSLKVSSIGERCDLLLSKGPYCL